MIIIYFNDAMVRDDRKLAEFPPAALAIQASQQGVTHLSYSLLPGTVVAVFMGSTYFVAR
jgi:hypothetical protein